MAVSFQPAVWILTIDQESPKPSFWRTAKTTRTQKSQQRLLSAMWFVLTATEYEHGSHERVNMRKRAKQTFPYKKTVLPTSMRYPAAAYYIKCPTMPGKHCFSLYEVGGIFLGEQTQEYVDHFEIPSLEEYLATVPINNVESLGAEMPSDDKMRTFDTGATRNVDTDKLDYEGFLSPLVLERYAHYLHKHRIQADGHHRASDNWTKGIPLDVYMKSLCRHFMETWKAHRGYTTAETQEDNLCAIMFNAMGYLFERLRHVEALKGTKTKIS